MKKNSSTDLALVLLGLLAWGIAIAFGVYSTVDTKDVMGSTISPNIASAGAACGFAIAGGLCFLAQRSSLARTATPAARNE